MILDGIIYASQVSDKYSLRERVDEENFDKTVYNVTP
jgi:hypothetical protein